MIPLEEKKEMSEEVGYTIEKQEINQESKETTSLKILYDYIVDSPEYNSLAGKTQILNLALEDKDLGLITRKMHDIQVSQNSMKIAKIIGLKPEEILKAQVMGIAHDLGIPPFGHDGEKIIDKELKNINKNYNFSHDSYGAEIFKQIIQRCNSDEDSNIFKKYDKGYINFIKDELINGVKNHSEYYGYKREETKPQKAVRLADTLSFIVSDLSDLMKKTESRPPIISKEKIKKEIDNMVELKDKEKIYKVIEKLESGDMAQIHEQLIEEAFSPKRNNKIPCTIIDDYKLLADIKYAYKDLKGKFNEKNKIKVLKTINEYFEYLTKYKGEAIENNEFIKVISEKIGKENPRYCIKFLRETDELISFMKGLGYFEDIFDDKRKEAIHKILLSKDIQSNIENQIKKIRKKEMKYCPTLMSLFIIHDKFQYREILGKNKEILGNDIKNEEKLITTMFQDIVKLSYIASQEGKNDLTIYKNRKIPKMDDCDIKSINYATYVLQQMENKDLGNDKKLIEIAKELGIEETRIEEIRKIKIDEIYEEIKLQQSLKDNLKREKEEENSSEKCNQNTNPLALTRDEIDALEIYEGVIVVGKKPFAGELEAYNMLNTLLFSGISNEKARVFDDEKRLNSLMLQRPKSLLKVSTDLFSAMYKSGKQMKEKVKVLRNDRRETLNEMKEKGEIVSNFSTSKSSTFLDNFKKKNMVLEEIYIEPGVTCIDFQKALGDGYKYEGEKEILIAPFNKVEIEEIELTDEDLKIESLEENKPAEKKVKIIVKPIEELKPLTKEEKKDKEENLKKIENEELLEKSIKFLDELERYKCERKPKEDFEDEIDLSNLLAYIEWKQAYQTVFKYRTREIALKIEKEIEKESEIENKKESEIKKENNMKKEIEELAESRNIKDLTEVSKNIEKTFGNKIKEELDNSIIRE